MIQTRSDKAKNSNRVLLLLGCGFLLLVGIAALGYQKIEYKTKLNLTQQLQATLKTHTKALDFWWQDKIRDATVLAGNKQIREQILSLLDKMDGSPWPRKKTLETPEAQFLRTQLGNASKSYGYVGFILFDKNAYQVLGALDDSTGTTRLTEQNDFIKRALAGESFVTIPFKSEIPLPDEQGMFHKRYPTMFVVIPIKDNTGEIAAALSFRIRPEVEFNRLLSLTRFGHSGESYAFDARGTLLTESRFNEDLIVAGLVKRQPGPLSMLHVEIRNPGGNLLEGFTPAVPRKEQPLTLMAQSATAGKSEINVDGYRDYRGVEVVGAWTWLEDKGFGITTEVDAVEAFAPLKMLQIVFFTLFLLLLVSIVVTVLIYLSKLRSKKRLEKQKELTQQKERMLGNLANTIIDAVITIDQKGIIQSFNPGAEKIFGYSPPEVIGRNVKILMDGEHQEKHDEYLKRYLETRVPRIIGIGREVIGLKKDGTHFDLELSISQSLVGEETWFTGICRDISERKQHEMEMRRARLEAEAANNAKSQFLARMSHELRTPLNAIIGFGQLLELDGSVTQNQKKSIQHIVNSGHHLLDLINDILDLSRIETDAIPLSLEPLDIPVLVREMITLTQTMALNSNIKISNQIAETLPYRIMGDRTRVKQILLNLVSNAIKYNREKGSVTLSCQNESEDLIEIAVEDTGCGISPDERHKLFVPFERLGAENSTIEGTGIGLAICLDLAKKMNGDIQVDSTPGQGSRFILQLPKAVDKPSTPQPALKEEVDKALPSLTQGAFTLLYIEDNPSNLTLVSQILEPLKNITLITAETGRDGIQEALKSKPDLILLDIDLPDINGLDLFKQLQGLRETCEIPVLGVSANALTDEVNKALKLGLKDYITKPINISEFLRKISHYLPVAK